MILRASLYLNLALLIVCLFVGGLWRYEVGRKHDILAKQGHDALIASEAAREHEQEDARRNAAIAETYEKGKADAQVAAERVIAGLRDGSLQLRKRWQGCVSGVAASAAERDAEAADRAESAARAVRAAREADEQIKALQDILRAERGR